MRKTGSFFRSIVPFLAAVALQLAVSIPLNIVYMFLYAAENDGGLTGFSDAIRSVFPETTV